VGEARLVCLRPTKVEEGSVPKVEGTATATKSGAVIRGAGWSRGMLLIVAVVAGLLAL
jgi:hypothetical protein